VLNCGTAWPVGTLHVTYGLAVVKMSCVMSFSDRSGKNINRTNQKNKRTNKKQT
jgi:hypothetical protein